jgi:DNA-binding PadR family transcriptional regulator
MDRLPLPRARDGDIVVMSNGDDVILTPSTGRRPVPKETLGELEELVLLAVLHLGDNAYGLAIVDELERTAHRSVARATVYVLLRRLEKAGLVVTRRESPDEVLGTPRRMVRVTEDGLEMVRRRREVRTRMWQEIEIATEDA